MISDSFGDKSSVTVLLDACVGGYTWSAPIANTNVAGGTGNGATGNPQGQQCYLILTTTPGPRNNGTATGVTHYDYYSSGCSGKLPRPFTH